MPAVAMEVLRLTESPKVDVQQLKQQIENDPALTAKLLRVVNSSLFGLPREICDLNQALALLGVNPLKLLVLGFSLPTQLGRNQCQDSLARYWTHALSRAIAARLICEEWFRKSGDEAFIAALLRDVGILALLDQFGDKYERIYRMCDSDSHALSVAERKYLGFDHVQLTAKLLRSWALPETLIPAQLPDDDVRVGPDSPNFEMERILQCAGQVCMCVAGAKNSWQAFAFQSYPGQVHKEADLLAIAEQVSGRVQELADILSLNIAPCMDFKDVLVEAHRRMTKVATQAAAGFVAIESAALAANMLTISEVQEQERHGLSLKQAMQELAITQRFVERRSAEPRLPKPNGTAGAIPQAAATGTWHATETHDGPARPAATAKGRSHAAWNAPVEQRPGEVALLQATAAALKRCRADRTPLSLVLLQVDRGEEFLQALEPHQREAWLQDLPLLCRELDHRAWVVGMGNHACGVLVPGRDRKQILDNCEELRQLLRTAGQRLAPLEDPITLSLGVACVCVPPRNFPPQELLQASERCIRAAKAAGGDCTKSIEF